MTTKCERCGECIKACPENILEKGYGGFPQVNFKQGECTFCGICADRCSNNTLQQIEDVPPWKINAYIDKNCLTKQGVICVICRENCELEAIEFSLNRVAVPKVNIDKCSGCGACYKACPVMAITIR